MNPNLTSYLPVVIWFLLSGLGTYLLRSQDNRIGNLEKRMLDMHTQAEVRDMMSDNLEPIKEDIKEIKERLNQLFTLVLNNHLNNKQD